MSSVNLAGTAWQFIIALPSSSISTVDISGNPIMACGFVPPDYYQFLLNYQTLTSIDIRECNGTQDTIDTISNSTFNWIFYFSLKALIELVPDQLIFDQQTGLQCPSLQFSKSFYFYEGSLFQLASFPIDLTASPSFINYAPCSCYDTSQFWNNQTRQCAACPYPNMLKCAGDPTLSSTNLVILPGFYPLDLQSRALDDSAQSSTSPLLNKNSSTVLVACSSQAVCNPPSDSASTTNEYVCGLGYFFFFPLLFIVHTLHFLLSFYLLTQVRSSEFAMFPM
jgi:hypothetical protein